MILKSKEICSLFMEGVFINFTNIHSVYLSGSYASGTVTEFSDIDFHLVIDGEVDDDLRDKAEAYGDSLGLDIVVDVGVDSIEEFKDDYLFRYTCKCIWGEDLSLDELDFDLFEYDIEKDLNELDRLSSITYYCSFGNKILGDVDKVDIREYIKHLLRTCFMTVCKETRVYTRDLQTCQYLFSQKYPEYDSITKELLDMYVDGNYQRLSYITNILMDYMRNSTGVRTVY